MRETDKYDIARLSWFISTFFLCVLPPVGFVLVIVRLLLESKLHEYGEDNMWIPGIAATAWGAMAILLIFIAVGKDVFNSPKNLLVLFIFLLCILGGILIFIVRSVYIRREKQMALIKTVIKRGRLTYINEIAEAIDTSREQTEEQIAFMIECGYLTGYRMDRENHCLQAIKPDVYVRCICSSCGAELQIFPKKDITCAYCGSPIDPVKDNADR